MEYLILGLKRMQLIAGGHAIVLALSSFLILANPTLARTTTLGPIDGEGLASTDLERVKVGEAAPDFTLESETGTPVTLSQFRGQNNVILVFYRGHW
jgi:cytochrome oxidase Cu insertion factor (SCO1/SenC/PrrC family)